MLRPLCRLDGFALSRFAFGPELSDVYVVVRFAGSVSSSVNPHQDRTAPREIRGKDVQIEAVLGDTGGESKSAQLGDLRAGIAKFRCVQRFVPGCDGLRRQQ